MNVIYRKNKVCANIRGGAQDNGHQMTAGSQCSDLSFKISDSKAHTVSQ